MNDTSPATPATGLTVRGVRVRPVDVQLKQPAVTAAGTFGTFPVILIDLLTQEGITGSSYIFAYHRFALKPLVSLVESLAEMLQGQALNPGNLEELLQGRLRLIGAQGLAGMALGGLDMAAWDALARSVGLPLCELLGSRPRPVRAYATLKNMTPDGAARDACRAATAGYAGVKVKAGTSLAQDRAVIEAIRREIGDSMALMVDYNQMLSIPEAIARGNALAEYQLEWIEEPTHAWDFEGHAEIARHVTTPISIGETWHGVPDAARSMACKASDYVMPDAMRIGGVTGWMRVAALAQAQGVPLSGHALPELSVHLLAATPTAHWLEYADIVEAILQEPLQVRDGCMVAPTHPGFGLVWDERAVERMAA